MAANGYDTIVIGGGIIGCSIAWRLAQAGQRVAVLERGHVIPALSEAEHVRRRTEFEEQAPAGIPASWLSRDDALALEPLLAPEVEAAVYYPDHGFVDNPKLTNALGGATRAAGGEVVENCLVTGLTIESGEIVGVETALGPMDARYSARHPRTPVTIRMSSLGRSSASSRRSRGWSRPCALPGLSKPGRDCDRSPQPLRPGRGGNRLIARIKILEERRAYL